MVILTQDKDRTRSHSRNKRAFVIVDGKIVERVVGREPKGRRKQKIKYFATEKVTTKNE
jgi:hypothetical protein